MSAPLLEVEGLRRHFVARRSAFGRPTVTVKAVDGINLTVPAGSTLALVGETGCGKSTVGRLLLRLIEPMAGSIKFAGRDILAFGEKELRAFRREAQIVFQDPYSSLNPRMTVEELISEPLALHDIVPASRLRDCVAELLGLVGLDARYGRRYPHEFSGGQRQRIAIARALAVEPKLIVCDEPVSALDPLAGTELTERPTQAVILDLHLHFARSFGGQTHRRPGCRHVSRAYRGERSCGRVVREPAPPLHARAVFGHPGSAASRPTATAASGRRRPQPALASRRLSFASAVLLRHRSLPDRAACACRRPERARNCVPSLA